MKHPMKIINHIGLIGRKEVTSTLMPHIGVNVE